MKRLFLLVAVLMLMASVEVFAFGYDFQFDVDSPSPFNLRIDTKELPDSNWQQHWPPSGYYEHSLLIPWSKPALPSIYRIRVKAWCPGYGSFEEIRAASLHTINYFYIDLHPKQDPTPPFPHGGGDD